MAGSFEVYGSGPGRLLILRGLVSGPPRDLESIGEVQSVSRSMMSYQRSRPMAKSTSGVGLWRGLPAESAYGEVYQSTRKVQAMALPQYGPQGPAAHGMAQAMARPLTVLAMARHSGSWPWYGPQGAGYGSALKVLAMARPSRCWLWLGPHLWRGHGETSGKDRHHGTLGRGNRGK